MTQQELYDALLDRFGPEVADEFVDAIRELKDGAEIGRLIAAIEAGNAEAAVAALGLDPAAFASVAEKLRDTYFAGGTAAEALMPFRFRFNIRNPAAEAWLRDESSTLVTRIVEDQRTAVRQALEERMREGANPRTTALDIVGRVNRQTGRREGGILGLSAPQERWVSNARAELSGGPEELTAYLRRKRRDKRFDRTVERAIREETPLPAEAQRKMIAAYERRLLQLRGETIGRTEALTSLHAAKHESFRQAIESGKVSAASVRRIWRSARDTRVRDSHALMDGQLRGFEEAFVDKMNANARLRFPGDTSLGAPARTTILCRCTCDYRVDFLANVR